MQPEKEPAFWLIKGISYQDTQILGASELVEHYQRDARKNSAKFWPGSKGVHTHLKANLPEGATLSDDSEEEKPFKRPPVILHSGTGLDIDISDD